MKIFITEIHKLPWTQNTTRNKAGPSVNTLHIEIPSRKCSIKHLLNVETLFYVLMGRSAIKEAMIPPSHVLKTWQFWNLFGSIAF